LLAFTLTIAFNLEKVRQYLPNPYFSEFFLLAGVLGILAFVYYTFRLDRETIGELKELFKAIKKLDDLKKESGDKTAKSVENLGTHDNRTETQN